MSQQQQQQQQQNHRQEQQQQQQTQKQQQYSSDFGPSGGDRGYDTTSSEDEGDYIIPNLSPLVDSPNGDQQHHNQQLMQHQQSRCWPSSGGVKVPITTKQEQQPGENGDQQQQQQQLVEQPARRRGRAPSKRPCLNKNALMARENRQRKKEYIQRIENKLQQYQVENAKLNGIIQKQAGEIKRLTSEVVYLKNVLSNNTVITTLLKAMNESLKSMYPGSGGSQTIRGRRNNDDDDGDGGGAIGSMYSMASSLTVSPFDQGSPGPSGSQSSYSGSATGSNSSNQSRKQQYQDSKTFARVPLGRKTMQHMINEQDHDYVSPKMENNKDSKEEIFNGHFIKDTKPPPEFINIGTGEFNTINVNDSPLISPNPLSMDFDKQDYSLSDTDFSQLSNFDVDLLNSLEKSDENPLQFERDTGHLFNEESLFNSLNQESMLFGNTDENFYIDPVPNKNLANNKINTTNLSSKNDFGSGGVCLHINSNKVSLEFCSICHSNSLKTEIV